LLAWLNAGEGVAAMDCWEAEPHISPELLYHKGCVIATPHIAGHSLDGKAANTQFVYNALCAYLNISPQWSANKLLPSISMSTQETGDLEALYALVNRFYKISDDVEKLKSDINGFSAMRRNYPIRRAWEKQSSYLAHVLCMVNTGEMKHAA
jgi:erythronate-4-phosphate dehydrogenase